MVVRGTNITGSQFIVQNLHGDATYALPPAPNKLQQLEGKMILCSFEQNKIVSVTYIKTIITFVSYWYITGLCFMLININNNK